MPNYEANTEIIRHMCEIIAKEWEKTGIIKTPEQVQEELTSPSGNPKYIILGFETISKK